MDAELKAAIDGIGSVQAEMKKAVDERFEKLEKGQGTAEVEQKFSKMFDDWSAKQDEKLTQIEAAVARKGGKEAKAQTAEEIEQKEAVLDYLRTGRESKAMIRGDDNRGGYTVTPEMATSIEQVVYETSPMDSLANVVNISSDQYKGLVDADDIGFNWADEQTNPDETQKTFRKFTIPVHVGGCVIAESQELLDDSNINLESYLSMKAGDRIARGQNAAFVNGNGVGKPTGFTTYPAGTSWKQIQRIASGNATKITADQVIKFIYSLKGEYRANATMAGTRLTLAELMLLKDDEGQYIFDYGNANDVTIKRVPYVEFNDMAEVSAGNLALAIADWRRAYTVVRRSGVTVLRDPYTRKPLVEHTFSARVGGDVVNFEAIKLMNIAAS